MDTEIPGDFKIQTQYTNTNEFILEGALSNWLFSLGIFKRLIVVRDQYTLLILTNYMLSNAIHTKQCSGPSLEILNDDLYILDSGPK